MHRQVAITLTNQWAARTATPGARLGPTEKLRVEEIGRRLFLEHVLWAESERGTVEDTRNGTVGSNLKAHPFRDAVWDSSPPSGFRILGLRGRRSRR